MRDSSKCELITEVGEEENLSCAISALGALSCNVHHRWGTIQERALFKRGHYPREGTTLERAIHVFFYGGTFFVIHDINQGRRRKTDPNVY